jgi:hypothetical protein
MFLIAKGKFEGFHAPCTDVLSILYCAKILSPAAYVIYYNTSAKGALLHHVVVQLSTTYICVILSLTMKEPPFIRQTSIVI